MKTLILTLSTVVVTATLPMAGCSKHDHHGIEKASGHDHSKHEMAAVSVGPGGPAGAGERVEVPRGGKQFEPPILPAQVPVGAWYCDMNGTVHYARGEQGDGACPVCHMKLVLRRQ